MSRLVLYLKNFDWINFFSVFLLTCFSLAEIYSISLSRNSDFLIFKKQVLYIVIGLLLYIFLSVFDYHNLKNFNGFFYILGIIILGGVLFLGSDIRGTRGWYSIGPFSLQPIEFVKIIVIIFLSKYFSSNFVKQAPLKHLFLSGFGVFLFVGLTLAQPDFGSAMILVSIWVFMIFLAGFPKKFFLLLFVVLLIIFNISWKFLFKEYQKQRILTFINPQENSFNQSYNINQAIIAIGAGKITGRGIGFGSQSQLKFLPEAQNDFIFAVIAEELGFLGVCLLLIFYFILFIRIIFFAKKTEDDFGVYFLFGAVFLIFIEMFINIGMNIGILPVVGISLPFISYGGSAIISTIALAGICQNIIIKSKIKY